MFQKAHDNMDEVALHGMSRPELTTTIGGLDRVIAHAEERRLACLAGIDALGDSGADAASVGHSLSRRSNRQSKQDAKVATQLAQMPAVAEGLASVELSPLSMPRCVLRQRRGYRRVRPRSCSRWLRICLPTGLLRRHASGSTPENLRARLRSDTPGSVDSVR